ncbi:GCN5-related N-acetyltransferase [Cellulomonas flavigena DSM 20109]|uniref:GCN5-related N-acetyltransferase n=1 Tax=Cellulomonas flavigena (strain ATCC 482 / DSM 20109 / BCRC 11376 / JCM 18109 / NBRC 3775 / NCIMB 8073 / NRS 134) TaxID=446466 RepID=D5UG09_CELFN|nr:GNAT family N-acetyltransferase [Cellulomonas flavigena]ADG75032.1 GCN5-related N-acetyltransferase [Cellulomonas flavigena DSM 20109]
MTRAPRPQVVVRPAVHPDAEAIAAVHHGSWVETYSDLLPGSHWETDTLERRTERWRRGLESGVPATVVEADGRVVGLALAGDAITVGPHAPVRERHLFMLYVLASHHGTGVGQALLDAVVPPGAPAQLWVAEVNPRARRFYERNGFVADGARHVDEGSGIAEVRLVR